MTAFDTRIIAQLAGPTVRCTPLVRMDFKSGERRYWRGFRTMNNGEEWEGIGNVAQIGTVQAGPGQAVDELTLTLFGGDDLLRHFRDDVEESVGREVRAYFQFFELTAWTPIGSPIQFFWGKMGPLFVDRPIADGTGGATRMIGTRAANAFTNRRRPVYGFYSDRDQKARSADGLDNFSRDASKMASLALNWPAY